MGEVFRVYFVERAPLLSDDWRSLAETRRRIFENAWPIGINVDDISQTHIDRYVKGRRDGRLAPGHSHGRTAVRSGTIDNDLRWLSSVFNWARKHKVDGKRLLSANPLHEVEWPKEKNLLRPVASHSRFTDTMAVIDRIDHNGRLRCMLALARYTGRRESAICHLRASDILRDSGALRRALADQGMDESQADHWQHGAIRWRASRSVGRRSR